uniref:Uncharacterized protein n=1 Tax=Arundo donax TaxID=35708 RepID=A0A0A8Y9L3_ARUDO
MARTSSFGAIQRRRTWILCIATATATWI